ncbi:MAG: hypothetical protein LJF15_07545 [Acidobacteria bacterium]|jgi:hypothetical protein|nr:hypothetical protein [Acidobacteriota bacterium]
MKLHQLCAVAFAVCLTASLAGAQDAPTFVFGTYYKCNVGSEDRADALYKETVGPLFQKQIDAGHLAASGWGRHWLGGEWRRLAYIAAPSLSALAEARQAVIGEMTEAQRKAGEEFNSVCPSHDDYIWTSVASSQAPEAVARDRAKVATSTYFVCDSHEAEADAIVRSAFAPVMNAHVKEGTIASWNWLRHVAGGKYRRLLVIDGTDHASLLEYWNTLDKNLADAQPELARRFSEICPSHTDYVWDLGTE